MTYAFFHTAPHQACYTKDGMIVPPEHVVARLNELERLRAAFQILADRMESVWGHHSEGGWRLPDSPTIRSNREECLVGDLVDQIISDHKETADSRDTGRQPPGPAGVDKLP